MDEFDVVVIGGGPGGYPAAITAARRGARVALVEREHLGGTCLNRGCIPTKTMVGAAELYREVSQAAEWGIRYDGAPRFDYAAMIRRRDRVVADLRQGVGTLLRSNGVEVIEGTASLASRRRVLVRQPDGASRWITASKVIIATGSRSAELRGVAWSSRVVDSSGFLALRELPARLVVVGGGYIGCELACVAAALGSQVTVVELLEDVLMLLDPDVRSEVRKRMEDDLKIRFLTGQPVERVEEHPDRAEVQVAGERLQADCVLVAVGRRPELTGLHVERAGIETDERGFVRVDDRCRTSAANVYAAGDINGRCLLAHAATSQGILAAEDATGGRAGAVETVIPGVIFTMPEVAVVGLTEEQARRNGHAVRVGRFPFAALGRAKASGRTTGFAKWIADGETGQLLGAQVVGAHATELIAEAALAIRSQLTAAELARTVHAHPTFSEVWMEAAHALHGGAIHLPSRRR